MSLFDAAPLRLDPADKTRPLAERMRPERLNDFVGQEHILSPGRPLREQIEHWTPDPCGRCMNARAYGI